jgi:hypothetical protein
MLAVRYDLPKVAAAVTKDDLLRRARHESAGKIETWPAASRLLMLRGRASRARHRRMRHAFRIAGTVVALALTLAGARPAGAWVPHSTVRGVGAVAVRQTSVRRHRSAADDSTAHHDRLPATAHRPVEATWSAVNARRDDARERRRLAVCIAGGSASADALGDGHVLSIVANRATSVLGAVFHEAHAPPRRVSSVTGSRS